ncbi:MAG: DUF4926 domain-containing protein [Cyanobacteria bacterium P01_H01_bin.35]
MTRLKELDIVALTEERQIKHFEIGAPITLYKGQVRTIVREYDNNVFEVDFSNNDGTTYAMEAVPHHQLMLLYYELVEVVA